MNTVLTKRDFLDAKSYFCDLHDLQGQKYADVHPYSFHLDLVAKQAKYWAIATFGEHDDPLYWQILTACYSHDAIEDARLTYNDIKERCGENVAEITFLCTEMRGRNRAERKPPAFYKELVENENATFVKLCDILANAKYSLLTNSGMYYKYATEFPKLRKYITDPMFSPMLESLESILKAQS
jgi:(p)ppGpp synthase/HD superfamily hydrolase